MPDPRPPGLDAAARAATIRHPLLGPGRYDADGRTFDHRQEGGRREQEDRQFDQDGQPIGGRPEEDGEEDLCDEGNPPEEGRGQDHRQEGAGQEGGARQGRCHQEGGAGQAKAAPAKPKKSPFPAKFLTQQEEALLAERKTYTRQADSLRAEADALVADFEPGDVQFDEESGEGDTLNIERERDLALSAQARQQVEEIDHALSKFADGTYGVCEVSGEPIPKERLEAIPWARERVEYKIGGLGRR